LTIFSFAFDVRTRNLSAALSVASQRPSSISSRGIFGLSSPAWAQQRTVKACQEKWRANKTTNHANGITEKAYVVQCRAGGTAAQAPPSESGKQELEATLYALVGDKPERYAIASYTQKISVNVREQSWGEWLDSLGHEIGTLASTTLSFGLRACPRDQDPIRK
jgi:hypothetical protein